MLTTVQKGKSFRQKTGLVSKSGVLSRQHQYFLWISSGFEPAAPRMWREHFTTIVRSTVTFQLYK